MNSAEIRSRLQALDGSLIEEMIGSCRLVEVDAGVELFTEGSYVKDLPVLINGSVRVFLAHEDKELLLYYIGPAESCVMSLTALLEHTPSRIHAMTELPCTLLLLPESELRRWMREHPSLNTLLYHQFHVRYEDLVRTIQQVTFGDLASRLEEHLRRLSAATGKDLLDVRHAKLAQELGTAREVVTRTLHKLEREGIVVQEANGLRLLRR